MQQREGGSTRACVGTTERGNEKVEEKVALEWRPTLHRERRENVQVDHVQQLYDLSVRVRELDGERKAEARH